jgi:hypothetical protein
VGNVWNGGHDLATRQKQPAQRRENTSRIAQMLEDVSSHHHIEGVARQLLLQINLIEVGLKDTTAPHRRLACGSGVSLHTHDPAPMILQDGAHVSG